MEFSGEEFQRSQRSKRQVREITFFLSHQYSSHFLLLLTMADSFSQNPGVRTKKNCPLVNRIKFADLNKPRKIFLQVVRIGICGFQAEPGEVRGKF